MKITVEVCDVCREQNGRKVNEWRVAAPGGRLQRLSLCAEHEKLLSALPLASGRPRRGGGRARVVPRDQV